MEMPTEFQPVEDGLGVVINGAIGAIPFVNVFGWTYTGVYSDTTGNAIAALVNSWYIDDLMPVITNQFAIESIVVTDLRTETGGQTVYTTDLASGDSTDQPLPFQTCGLISWGTGIRGRSYRGRTYIGGFVEPGSNGRTIGGAEIDAMEAFRDHVAGEGDVSVISRFHGVDDDGVPIKRDPAILTPITSGVVHPNWRTQRRRALASD